MLVVPMFVRKMFVRIRLDRYEYFTYVPYEHLHTNFSVQTFLYVLFSNELYALQTFAYKQLRTNYFHTYFGPRITFKIPSPI